MEVPITVSASGGTLLSLPGKLDSLLSEPQTRAEYELQQAEKDEIGHLKRDLEDLISKYLIEPSEVEAPALTAERWVKEVRELSYDVDDFVDELIYDGANASISFARKTSRVKIARLRKKLNPRGWITAEISGFRTRVEEMIQRHRSYHLDKCTMRKKWSDPHEGQLPRLHGVEAAHQLVDIDGSMKKLESMLLTDDGKRKVVSITGFGGVGKTTLAKQLYSHLRWRFECRAFVRSSRKPDMRRLLTDMLSQLRRHQPVDAWEVPDLIDNIRTHLQDKKYFIIIDDLWTLSAWDIVSCALTESNRCSRVLITTEVEILAQACCGHNPDNIVTMKPLSEIGSRELFLSRVFGHEHECSEQINEVSCEIIRKCGGFPLAIIAAASLLANQPDIIDKWNYVQNSFSSNLRTNPTPEGMKQVLNLSYNNLPQRLKACMLYLSIYQEDYIIWKDDLVKQWNAEGFISEVEGKDIEEVAGSYFNELINKGMIQPVHINENDEVLSCIVHHMVHNLITYKSIEENFAIAIDHSQTTTRLVDKVHRLSLHFGNAEDATPPTNMRLSQVRTLAFFGVFKCMASIVEFRLLQVLILHFWGDEESISFDLTRISELFRLRYLQVTCNVTLELQTQMRGLQYLETLKIDARVNAIPSDIVHLPGLLHLNLPANTNLPNGIGHMTSLRTLGYFDLSCNSIENVQSLGELTNLRDLQLTCYNIQPDNLKNMQCLGSILGKLSSLKSITLVRAGSSNVNTLDVASATSMSISGDGLSSVSSPPFLLQRLELSPRVCIFSSLPKWIGHLCKLCILKIGVRELARNVVDVLRGLPALTVLSLYVHTKPAERIVFDKVGFSVLKYFKFRCSVAWLEFGAGAMPNLRKLKLGFNAHAVDRHSTTIPVGIEHLSGLKEISAKIGGASAEEPDGRSAESALSDAIRMHPGRPNVNIHCVDRMFGGKGDESSGTQEEEHMALQKQCEIIEQDEVQGPEPLLPVFLGCYKRGAETAFPFMSPETSQSQVTISDSIQQSSTLKKSKVLPKWSRHVRVSAGQDEGPLDDGFSWRKYDQKDILGAKYPRSYYRCMHRDSQGCLATKKVQRTDDDPLLFDFVYHGTHTCTQNTQPQSSVSCMPAGTETSCVTASSFVSPATMESQVTISDGTTSHKERKALPKSSTQVSTLDDGFTWRKYGQKDIPGDKYPRIYMLSESSSHLPIPDAEHEKVESKQASEVEDAMVSSSTGAMNSLLKKHATLMGEEYAKLRGTRKEVMILKDELGAMNALLEKLADMDELNFQMKDWRNQMREMTYDIEDYIDDLMLQFDEDNAKPYYIHQPTAYHEKWDVLQKFILQIQSLMGKADLGSMVHKTEVQILGSSYIATESRLPAVYDKAVGLVGMDGPRDELVRLMMDGEQKHKVVCIFGPGGLGKTTLAKEVYNKIKWRFHRRIFVPAPQKIDITRFLRNIRHLQYDRYLIVLDGVWSAQTWKYIQDVLPRNNRASRIIITTNISDVAKSCVSYYSGFIYDMRPLHPDDSCRLFRSIIFGSERSCPIALEKVGGEILEACGGIPLAIIIIASFLATKPTEVAQWEMVEKRMDPAGKGDLTTEGILKKIFHICYSDLPRHMKSCLLYLSVFPGNHVIRKDRVIWRWIAEGFIPRRGEESLWETGESYFQELICRKLIEPTYDDEEDDDVPTSCKVHGVILEFITSLSNEENFVTMDAKTTYMQHGVIRRLTCNQEEDDTFWPITEDLSKVRSLTFFGDVKRMHGESLYCLRFLRVLDLEDNKNLENRHLKGIGRLVLLRYLRLSGIGIYTLPEEIGKLQHLETLDLRRTARHLEIQDLMWTNQRGLRTLPASIVGLQKLVRLLLDRHVELPREIWKVEKLEELSTIIVDSGSSLDSVAELLIKSKRLRMLGVRWGWGVHGHNAAEPNFRSFLKEVGKSNLQSLFLLLEGYPEGGLLDILLDSWVPPHHLRRFELTISGPLRGVPPKMASLVNLTHLRISIYGEEAEGLRVLGDLPNLILLKLESHGFDAERRVITSTDGFRCLVVFSHTCMYGGGMGLQFTPGAMPQLRRLRIKFNAWQTKDLYGDFDFGIQHLSCLTRVHAAITDIKTPLFRYGEAADAAEAAITEQLSKNPNSPVLELSDDEIQY